MYVNHSSFLFKLVKNSIKQVIFSNAVQFKFINHLQIPEINDHYSYIIMYYIVLKIKHYSVFFAQRVFCNRHKSLVAALRPDGQFKSYRFKIKSTVNNSGTQRIKFGNQKQNLQVTITIKNIKTFTISNQSWW